MTGNPAHDEPASTFGRGPLRWSAPTDPPVGTPGPDDSMRTAMRQVQGVFAQLDRAMITKRLRDGRKAKAAAGKHSVGEYAYGYTGTGKGRDQDAGPEADEQVAVSRIVELREAGESYRSIASTLDAEGHRPRRSASWSAMAVRNVAQREMSLA